MALLLFLHFRWVSRKHLSASSWFISDTIAWETLRAGGCLWVAGQPVSIVCSRLARTAQCDPISAAATTKTLMDKLQSAPLSITWNLLRNISWKLCVLIRIYFTLFAIDCVYNVHLSPVDRIHLLIHFSLSYRTSQMVAHGQTKQNVCSTIIRSESDMIRIWALYQTICNMGQFVLLI